MKSIAVNKLYIAVAFFAIAGTVCSCQHLGKREVCQKEPFGQTEDGQQVFLYTLENGDMKAKITNYGGIVTSLKVPNKDGEMEDIVLGYDNLEDYIKDSPYFGALIGRYGNRIAGGKFEIDGKTYELATNNEPGGIPCHLHGGEKGFDKVVWDAEPVQKKNAVGLRLHYLSEDGEEGYPGNLDVVVTYWLTDNNELKIDYKAKTDKATPVNLTQHSYFNLDGQGDGDILDHQLAITADKFTPVNKGLIPTGELRPVAGTPFDFTEPVKIGERIDNDNKQLEYGMGYDHNWALNNQDGDLELAATVYEPDSGRYMEVFTTEPGLQFYSGNFLDGTLVGKDGKKYKHRYGFCLETQHYPDSPNQPEFPSTILEPDEVYESTTIYRFSTM